MVTIQYGKIILILFVLVTATIVGSLSSVEMFDDIDTLLNDKGLPLSAIDNMNVRDTTYYKEVDGLAMRKALLTIVDTVYLGGIKSSASKETMSNSTNNLKLISTKLLARLNEAFNPKQQSKDDFIMIIDGVQRIEVSIGNDFIMNTTHIVHREGRMYGFVIKLKSLLTPDENLKGILECQVTGILPEDAIQEVRGCNNNHAKDTYRIYADAPTFIQSEAIMKPSEYEKDIIKKQVYGLLQDRGISNNSFK